MLAEFRSCSLRRLQCLVTLHLLHHNFYQSVDRFLYVGWIESVSDAGPDEFSLLRRDHIEVSLDAYLLFFTQVVGRVDYGVYRTVVSVKRVVVGEGSNVGAAWDICYGIVDLDQARHYDRINLVLSDLRFEVIQVELRPLGSQQDAVTGNRLHAGGRKLFRERVFEVSP